MTKIQLATKIWVMWCFNFDCPETFIRHMCEKTGKERFKEHLLGKWHYVYETYGSHAAMNVFYTELDEGFKNALVDYAINVYGPRGMKTTYQKYCNA